MLLVMLLLALIIRMLCSGHAILVGNDGCGRKSVVKLVTYTAGKTHIPIIQYIIIADEVYFHKIN